MGTRLNRRIQSRPNRRMEGFPPAKSRRSHPTIVFRKPFVSNKTENRHRRMALYKESNSMYTAIKLPTICLK